MKNKNFVFNLIQVIFTLVGIGMIIGGYLSKSGSLTTDGFPPDRFFYFMGAFFILWPALLFGIIKYFRRRAAARIEYLKVNGLKGKARVLSMHRTNLTVNNIPQMVPDLNITTSPGEHIAHLIRNVWTLSIIILSGPKQICRSILIRIIKKKFMLILRRPGLSQAE